MAQYELENIALKDITTDPGVYLFKSISNTILYIGKARSLRKRLSSYFRPKEVLPIKTQRMLQNAHSIDTIRTTTEKEALLLEASLIKRHKPRYNIVLKDDKQHVLFCIQKNTPYPRLEIVRKPIHKNAYYFGPFASSLGAKTTWKLLHTLFPLRRCSDRTLNNRVKPCLYYHIKQCLAPCVYDVPEEQYEQYIQKVLLFLRGKADSLLDTLTTEMHLASEALEFEKAISIREQIYSIQKTIEKQVVILQNKIYVDVIGIAEVAQGLGLSIIFIREGRIIDTLTFYFHALTMEDSQYLLYSFLGQYYTTSSSIPPRILLPYIAEEYQQQFLLLEEILHESSEEPIHIVPAQTAVDNQLVDIAIANAREATPSKTNSVPEILSTLLGTAEPIRRIEAVDVSHTSGSDTRVGLIVCEEGYQEPIEYRNYALEGTGGDDYKALGLWIERRMQDTTLPFPDMLLIDGGKGQLSVIERYINTLYSELPFPLVAITKARTEDGRSDRRAGNIADRLFIPGRSNPLNVHSGSQELLYLQKVRDMVHDFSIGRHRTAHRKHALEGELLRIKGIGEQLATTLVQHFGSVRDIAHASVEAIAQVKGISIKKAQEIKTHLEKILQ